MSNLTIEEFWKRRLIGNGSQPSSMVQGWSYVESGLETFKEAPLSISADFDDDSVPESTPILLVSAPGAVGKTTLAKQIAFETGAVYLDLAKSEPVGANTLSGGLVKSELYEAWKNGKSSILIDGIDEARIRVTQESFEAFLSDVADLSKERTIATVIFGRTGAIQDSWLMLAEKDVKASVLEIGYYDSAASLDFANALLQAKKPDSPHQAVREKAARLLLDQLRGQTENDGDRFAGYAPVLQAVVERVDGEDNPSALVAQIEKGPQPATIQNVASAILDREHSKLNVLSFEDTELINNLYTPEEQLNRLAAHIHKLPAPELPHMSPNDAKTYSSALKTWVPEHPFLDGNFGTSSIVFDALVNAHALQNQTSATEVVLRRELKHGASANPFLAEFYMQKEEGTDSIHLPPEHIGIVYASLRAKLSLGDSASLLVEGLEGALDEEVLRSEVEITLERTDTDRPRTLSFTSDQTSPVLLGTQIEDVDIVAPYATVHIGPGTESILIGPVNIQCEKLVIESEKVIVEGSYDEGSSAVFLEAGAFDGGPITSVPVLRGDVSLKASWPEARNFPWTTFATTTSPIDDPRLDEALRRFRKFVISFRSHSKGNLKRFKDKIEHARMTKGTGQSVLNLLVNNDILSKEGEMYVLDQDKLSEETGVTYTDCMSRRFGEKAKTFIQQAL